MSDALAALTQAVLYAAIVVACGAVFAEASLSLDANATARLRRAARWGAVLVVLAACAGAGILMQRLGGEFDEATLSALFVSNVGAAFALRIAGALMLLFSIGEADDAFANGLRLSYAGLIVASFAFSGHAAADGLPPGFVACAHVAIASWWVGALIAMRTAYANDTRAFAELVTRFSKVAVGAIAGLIGAGIILIVVLVDLDSEGIAQYIQLLALKIVIACCVFALAAYNKFRLTPRLVAQDANASQALRRMIDFELLAIGVVLLATAVLTTYVSPHE